jgi:hypothetical protein
MVANYNNILAGVQFSQPVMDFRQRDIDASFYVTEIKLPGLPDVHQGQVTTFLCTRIQLGYTDRLHTRKVKI